ncbi:MAG: Holin family protein [Firmicutes bacterium ADurb.Bin182]|nr:MAG: Holin family protein [Firmicutes bacterium ADurb.Bin182]
MKALWPWFQAAAASAGAVLGWFLGGMDGFLYALIAFAVIDYITGVLCAVIDKKLCSEIGARGIIKKVMIFVLVGVAHVIDDKIIGVNSALRTAVIFFYLSNEGISILENASRIGLPVPERLKDVLKMLHGKEDEKDDKNKGDTSGD